MSTGFPVESPRSIAKKIDRVGAELTLAEDVNAVPRLLTDKVREQASIMDFDAVGDGVTDDRAAFVDAAASGLEIRLPPGNYLISSSVVLDTKFIFLTGAKLVVPNGVTVDITGGIDAYELDDIFTITGTGRVLLPHAFSLMWFGAANDDTGEQGAITMTALQSVCNVDGSGYAQKSGTLVVPEGTYRCTEPVTYKGNSGLSLTILGAFSKGIDRGGATGSNFAWHGTNRTFMRWQGANGSMMMDIKCHSYAGTNCQEIFWVDAINGDVGATGSDSGSSGIKLERCYFTIQPPVSGPSCNSDTACLAIGHQYTPGGGASTSQVSEMVLKDIYCVGQSDDLGYGIHVREGGNVKIFELDRVLTSHLNVGLYLRASGYYCIKNSTGGGNQLDIFQTAGGQLNIFTYYSEASYRFLEQSGGTGLMNCTVQGMEWAGWPNTAGGLNIITIRGMVQLKDVIMRCDSGSLADSIPWIAFANDPRYDAGNHAALIIDGLEVSAAYIDTDGTRQVPVRYASWVLTDPYGELATDKLPLWIKACVTLDLNIGDPIKMDYNRPFIPAPGIPQYRISEIVPVHGLRIYNLTKKKESIYTRSRWGEILVNTDPANYLNVRVADLTDDPYFYPGKHVGSVVNVVDEVDGPCLAKATYQKWQKVSDGSPLVAGNPYDVVVAQALCYFDCQEASGNLIDAIQAVEAVPQASPLYQEVGPTAWLPYAIKTYWSGLTPNYFIAPNIPLLNVYDNDLSLVAWIKTESFHLAQDDSTIFGMTNNVYAGANPTRKSFRAFLLDFGYPALFYGDDTQFYNSRGDADPTAGLQSPLSLNTWYLVVWGRDSINRKTFCQVGTNRNEYDEDADHYLDSGFTFNIGYDGTNFSHTGWIAGIGVYNKVLTTEDIDTLLAGP